MVRDAAAAIVSQETPPELPQGAAFLLEPVGATPFFTPEQFTDEQRQMYQSAREFADNEVAPRAKEIEAKKPGLMPELLRRAGELGFLMIDIPEKYGGLGADKTTSMLVAEAWRGNGSWAVSIGGHTGIGTLPIVFYGNEEQKRRYLPRLATGELLAAYALTEPNAGSDALSGKTRADLSADGKHYILNGQKAWITNAGFADVFIVFAKVGGEKLSGFIVDRGSPGLIIGPEERKMGIRGSSTCALTFEDCRVPVENLLGEIGKGHKIAFNILNVGRFKLGVGTLGGAKNALRVSVEYAKERRQFGRALSEFGLIKAKIGEIATRIYAVESMAYRLSGLMDARIALIPPGAADYQQRVQQAIEEYVVEASILKIAGSELLDDAADEAIQIHGGYGYSEEYAPERLARDSRINRIFEGTNEINRMLIPGTLLKRAMKGEIPLLSAVGELAQALAEGRLPAHEPGPLGHAVHQVELAKRAALYALNAAVQKYMMELQEQQEILAALADMVMDVYGMDSAVGRALQLQEAGGGELASEMARLYATDAYDRVLHRAQVLLESISEGDELALHRAHLAKLSVRHAFPRLHVRRRIADACIDAGGYRV
jgi:alkylation response protein AidB-like acyl-CoA dehydrogenase